MTGTSFIDNVDRLPLEFLRKELCDQPDLLAQLDAIDVLRAHNANGQDKGELDTAYDALRTSIEANAPAFRRLKSTLRDAIDLARKRHALELPHGPYHATIQRPTR